MSTEDVLVEIAKIFTVCADAYIVFDYLGAFYERKVKRKFFLLGAFSYMLIMLAVSYIEVPFIVTLNFPIGVVVITVLTLVMYKGNTRAKLLSVTVYFLFQMAFEMIIFYSINLFMPVSAESIQQSSVETIPLLIFDKILLFLFFKGVIQIRRSSQNRLIAKDFLALIFVSFVSLCIMITFIIKDSISDNTAAILNLCISFGLFIANIFIFNLFLKSAKYAKIEMEQSLILQNIESSEKRYGEVVAIQNQIRGMWHDINNHISVVKGMIATEEGSAAKYIDELEKKVGEYASQVAFGNTIIDSVLYTKTARAKELGIDISSSLEMDKNIRISPVDLCTIFSNGLDNAIEACEEVAPERRFIRLKAVQNQGFLYIKIINSSEDRKRSGNEFRTTKKDRKRHGIGLKSIQNAVEGYSGSVSTDYRDGIFELSILLNT